MTQLGRGIYLIPQAARLVGVPSRQLRRWMLGSPDDAAVFPTLPPIVDGIPSLEFVDLISALFIKAFRKEGVSLQRIRRVAHKASSELGDPRPFSLRSFTTDGRRIYRWVEDEEAVRALLDVDTGQFVMRAVYDPLLRSIDYGTEDARRWHPLGQGHLVVVDPGIALGAPTVRGIPTRVLACPISAGASPAEVASWFEISEFEVLAACEFERKMHAKAA